MVELRSPHWKAIKNPEAYAKRMPEKERIKFIRKYGSELQKKGMKAIFQGRKYTPVREGVWERTGRGKRMVQTIVEKRIGKHIEVDGDG